MDACKEEHREVSDRIKVLREAVIERSRKLNRGELEVNGAGAGGVDSPGVDSPLRLEAEGSPGDDGAAAGLAAPEVTAMKQSMTKLGTSLNVLAQTMPDKMDGFARTICAVQDGLATTDDVNEAIASSCSGVTGVRTQSLGGGTVKMEVGKGEEKEGGGL